MTIKTKISVAALVLAAFVLGGFTLNAYKAEALKGAGFFFHKFGVNKEEWKAHKEGWKEMSPEERKAKMGEWKNSEEWQAKMEGWEAMSSEERRAKMEEMKGFGCKGPFGLLKKFGFGDEVNHEAIALNNGIQITITSDNPDIVQKLHDFVEKINNR